MATLLAIVREFCGRVAIPTPSVVVASNDDQYIQLWKLANEICDDLSNRPFCWTALATETTFTTVAANLQGTIDTICPSGYQGVIPETFWDRTRTLPFIGPLDSQEWQTVIALPATNPLYAFRIFQNNLYIWPVPTAGHTCAFEYYSSFCVASAASVAQEYFLADTDTFRLSDKILLAGLKWIWKREKGLPYAEDFTSYENLITALGGRDGPKKRINMSQGSYDGFQPGIFVSPGNWPL